MLTARKPSHPHGSDPRRRSDCSFLTDCPRQRLPPTGPRPHAAWACLNAGACGLNPGPTANTTPRKNRPSLPLFDGSGKFGMPCFRKHCAQTSAAWRSLADGAGAGPRARTAARHQLVARALRGLERGSSRVEPRARRRVHASPRPRVREVRHSVRPHALRECERGARVPGPGRARARRPAAAPGEREREPAAHGGQDSAVTAGHVTVLGPPG